MAVAILDRKFPKVLSEVTLNYVLTKISKQLKIN